MLFENIQLKVDKSFKDSEAPEQLKLWIVATHSDMPINMRLYRQDEMAKAVITWITPFQKPILKHHDNYTDAIGRVVEAHYISKEEWNTKVKEITGKRIALPKDSTGAILLKAYVTDKEAVEKIVRGNYTTVSVGFFADDLVCNICGKRKPGLLNMLPDELDEDEEYCEHITGQEYDGVVAYDVPLGIQYRELSFVNSPADTYAGIAKVEHTSLQEALKELKVEVFGHDENVNLTLIDSDTAVVNSDKEGYDMEELKKIQDAYQDLERQYRELEDAHRKVLAEYDMLKDAHEKLLTTLKEDLIDRVVGLKAIVLGIEDEEALNNLKESYKDYSVEVLKSLEREFRALVDSMLDESDCETCEEEQEETNEETEEQSADPVQEENEVKESEETKDEEVAQPQIDEVNLTKEKSPIKLDLDGTISLIDRALGIVKK